MAITEGKFHGRYLLLSELGSGGMGEVHLAEDTKLDRKVAIKFLNAKFSQDSEKLKRFVQEAKATSALNHPNILTVYEIDEFEGAHYIATEHIDGKTLRDLLAEQDTLGLNKILKIGIQTAEALSAAHDAGIAHRDIKPENIMIREDGYVKVLDFGLAKLTEKNKRKDLSLEGETKVQVKTNPGTVMGTASYMSPEQARGKETDERTDIWSLGVVLYEMLSGKVPFGGETINHTIVSILETEPKLLENVPDELQRIIRKMLTKEKSMRYQNSGDLAIDLKNLRRELDLQGELERSIMPTKETGSATENETQFYAAKSVEETNAGQEAETQKVMTASSLEYAVGRAKGNKLVTGALGLILIGAVSAIGYFGFYAGEDKAIDSIAVMPFVNESGNKDIEYLSDGMTETLISRLTEIPNLSVKARSTVFYYKGKNKTPKEIGDELGVEAVLLGRVKQQGDDLRLSLELVNAKTLDAIWSETYNRKMSDLVTLQSEIARNVSNKLRLKLTPVEQEKVAKTYSANSEAQQLYLKGRFHWNERGTKNLEKAVEYFKQAIEKDPNYALAYTGLADSYGLLPSFGDFRPKEYMPLAKQAAQKALELDDNIAEAHASLGLIIISYDHDWEGAEREYKRAIELNPNYATAHQWYGELLYSKGKHDEAIKELSNALELEPFSRPINFIMGLSLFVARRYDEAIVHIKKTRELFSDNSFGYGLFNRIYHKNGIPKNIILRDLIELYPEQIEEFKEAFEKDGWKGIHRIRLKNVLERRKTALEKDRNAYVRNSQIALAYANLNEKEKTFEYLNKAFDEREGSIFLNIKVDPAFDFLRDDPRFKELIKKVGFPE